MVVWINEAYAAGARQSKACEVLGISSRTLQRWRENGQVKADGRGKPDTRSKPHNKLSPLEQQRILDIANSQEFAHLPPNQIVPMLYEGNLVCHFWGGCISLLSIMPHEIVSSFYIFVGMYVGVQSEWILANSWDISNYGHLFAYGVLTVFVSRCKGSNILKSAFAVSVIACVLELVQLWLPDRQGESG